MPIAVKPRSLPLRERGLKFDYGKVAIPDIRSLPLRERGLKSSGPARRLPQ